MDDKLKFLADECCDTEPGSLFKRARGHDVSYVLEKQSGVSDDDVLLSAFNQGIGSCLQRIRILESLYTG